MKFMNWALDSWRRISIIQWCMPAFISNRFARAAGRDLQFFRSHVDALDALTSSTTPFTLNTRIEQYLHNTSLKISLTATV